MRRGSRCRRAAQSARVGRHRSFGRPCACSTASSVTGWTAPTSRSTARMRTSTCRPRSCGRAACERPADDGAVRAAAGRVVARGDAAAFPGTDAFTFTAPNLQYLMDSPAEFSTVLAADVYRAGRGPHAGLPACRASCRHRRGARRACAGRRRRSSAKPSTSSANIRPFEGNTYTFIADYLPWANGDGMEHRNSTVLTSPPRFAQPARSARSRLARVLPRLERRADSPAVARAVQSSKTRTCRASCGWRKGSPATTGRSC